MTPSSAVTVRAMNCLDVPAGHALSQALSWPHRPEDWAQMFRLCEGVVLEHDGHVTGTSFTCNQGGYASIGLVIVDSRHQGQGLGRRLMEQSIAAAGGRNVLLNATLAGAPLYRRLGFKAVSGLNQYQAVLDAPVPAVPPPTGHRLRDVKASDLPALFDMACTGTGMDRRAVLTELILGGSRVRVLEHGQSLSGVALCRRFGRGYLIGPVLAPSVDLAVCLIADLLQDLAGSFVRIDSPSESGLHAWLQRIGLNHVDGVEHMVLGEPATPSANVQQFALASQALG
jgi:GNAT superfamily N-acetyltransferase